MRLYSQLFSGFPLSLLTFKAYGLPVHCIFCVGMVTSIFLITFFWSKAVNIMLDQKIFDQSSHLLELRIYRKNSISLIYDKSCKHIAFKYQYFLIKWVTVMGFRGQHKKKYMFIRGQQWALQLGTGQIIKHCDVCKYLGM